MSKTKIKSALSSLEKAAADAFKVLNNVAEQTYSGSPAEANPLRFSYEISQRLNKELEQIEARTAFDGMSEEEIAEKKAADLAAIRQEQAQAAAEKLKSLKPKAEEPEPESEEDPEDSETETDDPGSDPEV
ncbi:hypothetical protein [Arundinibacter roseus]|uniref:Uncharacterized protein n=1 Tax=Arundinibacter roseus TaxID=2070510 RepID=A0A4R4KL75_9BACT|nr:hypothetical protein [Arundinibacter roseus]TDB69097.1 hypothetical protein EZE20_01815 [Arundinibacter roseus]